MSKTDEAPGFYVDVATSTNEKPFFKTIAKNGPFSTEALAIACLEHVQENGLPGRDHWAIAREVLPDGSQRILDISMKAIEAEIRSAAQGDKPPRRSRGKRKRGR